MRKNLFVVLLCLAAASFQSNGQTLMYYWNFNTWTPLYTAATPVSGTAGGLGIYAAIPADYAAGGLSTANADWVEKTIPGVSSSYSTYCDNTAVGDTTNARMGAIAGAGFKARNPNDSMELLIYAPTTGFTNLWIKYACELSSYNSGDSVNVFSYSNDSGATWKTSGAGLDHWVDSGSLAYRLVSVHVLDTSAYNNSKFVFRMRMVGRVTGTTGNDRYDNVTVEGTVIPGLEVPVYSTTNYSLYPNPSKSGNIEITSDQNGDKTVIITNMLGQVVLSETASNRIFSVNTGNLQTGVYYISIRENESGSLSTMKFMKQ